MSNINLYNQQFILTVNLNSPAKDLNRLIKYQKKSIKLKTNEEHKLFEIFPLNSHFKIKRKKKQKLFLSGFVVSSVYYLAPHLFFLPRVHSYDFKINLGLLSFFAPLTP